MRFDIHVSLSGYLCYIIVISNYMSTVGQQRDKEKMHLTSCLRIVTNSPEEQLEFHPNVNNICRTTTITEMEANQKLNTNCTIMTTKDKS